MNKISHAISEIYRMDTISGREQWINKLHPLVKLILTVFYIAVTVSFPKYNLAALAAMVLYPIAGFVLADLSVKEGLWRLRIILPIVCVVGIANPFLDKTLLVFGNITIHAGIISMITLMMKGVFAVLAAYVFIATTSIEKICYALRILHIPKILVTQIMLTYRYITVLLAEVHRTTQAYALRAPGQKGIHIRIWGSLTGQLLLRSIDRANELYESMALRGYNGDFQYIGEKISLRKEDIIYLAVWITMFLLFRKVPVILLVGSIFV